MTTGGPGIISAANSLVGSTKNDEVGGDGVTALSNGNYVVSSGVWHTFVGAVTFGSGTTGVSGVSPAANRPRGSTKHYELGGHGVTATAKCHSRRTRRS